MDTQDAPAGEHGHAGGHEYGDAVRLLASNGEYVTVDEATGEMVARQSPGRDWDTWQLKPAAVAITGADGQLHLSAPSGYLVAESGDDGELKVNRPSAVPEAGFTLVPVESTVEHSHRAASTNNDEPIPEHGAGHGEPIGEAIAVRAASGHFIGLEPNTDRLVARADAPTAAESFVVERVTQEALAESDVGKVVVTPAKLAVTGVHAVVLPTGNVLFFSYTSAALENNLESGRSQLWNPDTGPVPGSLKNIPRNLFCSAHAWIGDGRVLISGGQSNNWPVGGSPGPGVWGADHDVHNFDPRTGAWTRRPDMPAARYYPTLVTLADGNVFVASGAAVRGIGGNVANDDYEIYDRHTNRCGPKRRFRPHGTDYLNRAEYPFLHLLDNGADHGLLFVFSWNEARLWDVGAGSFRAKSFKTASAGGRTYPHQGAAVLLPIRADAPMKARVMVIGGQDYGDVTTKTAEVFEFDGTNPDASRWRPPKGGQMRVARFMSDAVLLPDETVLVVNGAGRGAADKSFDPVYQAEVFDTRTETWRLGATINRARLYHSTAVLLADGRVAIAGNTYTFNPGNEIEDRTVELYSPPYLFRGPRPEITAAPEIVPYGQDLRVATPNADAIESVSLLRAGSVTHTNNMDQRHVILPIKRRERGAVVVGAPPKGTIAPPGPYMLFLLSRDRIPSKGRFVHVREAVRDAAYVSQSVPTTVKAGEQFTVTVTMRNTGTLTWTRDGQYRLGSQSPQDNSTWSLNRVEVPGDVPPGGLGVFSFRAKAPAQGGVHAFQWRMVQEAVQWFGGATPPVRIAVTGTGENPECNTIRAQIESINEQIVTLQGELTGDPKRDRIILAQINRLRAQARALVTKAQGLGCVLAFGHGH